MSFLSCAEMLTYAHEQGCSLAQAVLRSDLAESRLTEADSRAEMRRLWQVMQATSRDYDPDRRSRSGLVGGDAAKVERAAAAGQLLGGEYLSAVTAEALKTAECNACMKRIVAAPTAGSCGVLPAVLLPLARMGEADDDTICDALYVAAGFGQVIAARATLAGAEGGCQAEVGAASAMAAAALCYLKGGTPASCASAAAMALGNLLGLVCDPVAGLVEVPCVKRNVVGAVNAVACANMALSGIDSAIPCDEVIDAMGRVGLQLSPDLRETGAGGLAATPTGRAIARRLASEAGGV
ncbi:L-serine ammonia-lyase, iron-sulfur-dependent, subunit alpha [Faecalibacterium sp. An77]|uniref:L-serine ammonia-lyase, iron-sulfur-dependent, subunit alpha n=1 Tax=Faecalibacterium sp. An77 TaxID=1965655 RepID=UPI000B39DBB0|nr:L-serine ammonia-lyase, iron-sulfur-dependent, subunit alpha [Faecalibacterium sp. An77]OUN39313.1 L-serine ammonia-lyase, iron-sulfur-dependent, subunit alpha [Faecalibacterium sp. An77]